MYMRQRIMGNNKWIMKKLAMPKAINRKKLITFDLSIIAKWVAPMSNEKLDKLKHEQYVA